MSKHASISPEEAQTGLAIRELVEAYAASLTVAMRKVKCLCLSRTPLCCFHDTPKIPRRRWICTRATRLQRFCGPEQVRGHHSLRRTEHNLNANGRPCDWRAYCLAHHFTADDGKAALMWLRS